VIALEDRGDRLDQGVLGVLPEVVADALHELEELLGFPFGFADDQHVRIDLVIALVEFVEEHGSFDPRWLGPAVYAREVR
jgi:hypothetical protein